MVLMGFAAADGYFYKWKTSKRLLYWNKLTLNENNDSTWQLTAGRDFELIEIPDILTITVAESLQVFDQPLRDSGYYRLYFRFSDTSSAQLQKIYQTIISHDTAGVLLRTVEDVKKAYQNIQIHLGLSPAPSPDTAVVVTNDSTKQLASINRESGADDEITVAIRKIIGKSQVILAVGVGIALSVGSDLLRGDAYCAYAKSDAFHLDSLKLGAYAGTWEGSPIDVLFAIKKEEVRR